MLRPGYADRRRLLWLACGLVCGACQSAAGEAASPAATRDFGLTGGPEVLWAYQYRVEGPDELRLLRFVYRGVGDAGPAAGGFVKPRRLRAVTGDLMRAAVRGESLHVFYVDGTHLRYHSQGSAVERDLPLSCVPVAVTGDETRDVLYALVPASVALAVREPEPEREPTTQPRPAGGAAEGQEGAPDAKAEPIAPVGDYALVRYERGVWHRDRDAPEWLTSDVVGPEGLAWLAASDGVCHLLARSFGANAGAAGGGRGVLYSCNEGEVWTAPERVLGVRPDELALAAVYQGQLVLVVRSPAAGAARLLRWKDGGFEAGPALEEATGVARATGGGVWAVFGQQVAAGFRDDRGDLSIGCWSVADGRLSVQPAPVEALILRSPPWAVRLLPFIAYGVLTVLLLGVFWRRRASLAVPAALPPDQVVARHWRRMVAFAFDAAIMLPVWALIMLPVMPPMGELSGADPEEALGEIHSSPEFVVRWLIAAGLFATYCTAFEASMGATPGKRIMQCRVADERGGRCRFRAVALRNLIRVVEMFYLFNLMPAVILILLTRNRQRLGDLIARTLVVERALPVEGPDSDGSAGY
ncbi:MAG TPA: RDD family protein [Phycisphaerae bacterium]|nr:RDD family protein [Phycisphaerae bacterium]